MREVGTRHLKQREQGTDHGKLRWRQWEGHGRAGWGGSSGGAQEGLRLRAILALKPFRLIRMAPKGNCRRPERAGTETLPWAPAPIGPGYSSGSCPYLSLLPVLTETLPWLWSWLLSFVVPWISFISPWFIHDASYGFVNTFHHSMPHVPHVHKKPVSPLKGVLFLEVFFFF